MKHFSMKLFSLCSLITLSVLITGCGSSSDDPIVSQEQKITGKVLLPENQIALFQLPSFQQDLADFILSPAAAATTGLTPVNNALIELVLVNNSFQVIGAVIASTTSDANGEFLLSVDENFEFTSSHILRVKADNGVELRAFISSNNVTIDPISEYLVQQLSSSSKTLDSISKTEITALEETLNNTDIDLTFADSTTLANTITLIDTSLGEKIKQKFVELGIETAADPGGDGNQSSNVKPIANSQNVSIDEDNSLAIILTASDEDGDALTFEFTNPEHGNLTGTAPNLSYTPAINYNGLDEFTFTVSDGTDISEASNIKITVNAVDDLPTALSQSVILENSSFIDITLNGSHADGLTITPVITEQPVNGVLGSINNNTVRYTKNDDFFGSDSFNFVFNDGKANSSEASINIDIRQLVVNTAPTADSKNLTVDEDNPLNINLTASDGENDSLTYTLNSPQHGTLSGAAPNIIYTPTLHFNGEDSFTFSVSDGTDTSNIATINLTVNPVPDSPLAQSQTLNMDNISFIDITFTGTHPDDLPITAQISQAPQNGTLGEVINNTVRYTVNAGFNGLETFKFILTDDTNNSNEASININISQSNVGQSNFSFYQNNGVHWNDYVENDGINTLSASDTTCTGATDSLNPCIQAGLMRSIMLKNVTSCFDIEITDHLNAFEWSCLQSDNHFLAVSNKLKASVSLASLIDSVNTIWKENKVIVKDNNGAMVYESPLAVWWNTTITNVTNWNSFTNQNTIYIVNSQPTEAIQLVNKQNMSIIFQPDDTLNLIPGTSRETPGLSVQDSQFIWFEAKVDAKQSYAGIILHNSSFSTLNNVEIFNGLSTFDPEGREAPFAIALANSHHLSVQNAFIHDNVLGLAFVSAIENKLENIKTQDNILSIYIDADSHYNLLNDIVTENNQIHGLTIAGDYNRINRLTSANNGTDGLSFDSEEILNDNNEVADRIIAEGNVIKDVRSFNNGRSGIDVWHSNDTVLINVLTNNNGGNGIFLDKADNSIVMNATTANNGSNGLQVLEANNNQIISLVSINNLEDGIDIWNSSTNKFQHIASSDNLIFGIGEYDNGTGGVNNEFSGELVVGNNASGNCSTGANADLGNDCLSKTGKLISLSQQNNIAQAFIGKIGTTDTKSLSNNNGSQTFSLLTDWTGFENDTRTWGRDGDTFPNVSNPLPCNEGESCRIWDWALIDNGNKLNKALGSNSGNNGFTHMWSDGSSNVFLLNAVELAETGNGLCESYESCLVTPNLGYYQGHGDLDLLTSSNNNEQLINIGKVAFANSAYDVNSLAIFEQEGKVDFGNIQGLKYETVSFSGQTDLNGSFAYGEGNSVVFSIGNILLGSAKAKSILTLVDLFNEAVNTNDPRVINLARFLLTLDDNQLSTDGIFISQTLHNSAIELSTPDWTNTVEIENTIKSLLGESATLVSEPIATDFLNNAYFSRFAGDYAGEFSGYVNGTWTMGILCDGTLTANAFSDSFTSDVAATGKLTSDKNRTVSFGDISFADSIVADFTGFIASNFVQSGTWKSKAGFASGIYSGIKTSNVNCSLVE